MRKALVVVLLVVVAFVGFSAAKAIVLKVKVQSANVRSEPDTSASVIAQLKSGTLVEAASKVDSWYEISVKDKSGDAVVGYIHSSVVEVVGGETPAAKPAPAAPREPERRASRPAPASASAPAAAKKMTILGGLAFANQRLDSDSQDMIDSSDLDKGNLMGPTIGLSYELMSLSDNLSIEIGGYMMPGGMKLSGKVGEDDLTVKMHGNAVGVGLVGKFKLSPAGATPFALAGIDVGYVLSMKTTSESGGEKDEEDILDDINKLYYGIDLGIGYEMQLGGMTLVIEGRYLLGLSNMLKKPDEVEDKDWKNYAKPTTMGIMVGIKL
jgi:hypothetical protein